MRKILLLAITLASGLLSVSSQAQTRSTEPVTAGIRKLNHAGHRTAAQVRRIVINLC